MELRLSDFNFSLPAHLIAQESSEPRDHCRLLVLNRRSGQRQHLIFNQIKDFLHPGDLLVVNNTQVVPARLLGKKQTGAGVECLILSYPEKGVSGTFTTPCLLKSGGRIRPGDRLQFGEGLEAEVLASAQNGRTHLCFTFQGSFEGMLKKWGRPPLPPYILRKNSDPEMVEKDRQAYQTVYAAQPGAIAAPTAGLHFTQGLLADLKGKGVDLVSITLHVGYGTFAPIKSELISEHRMHSEVYQVTAQAAGAINEQKSKGGRIIAVGTTTVRVLEHQVLTHGRLQEERGACGLFITPGFRFQLVDGMITNFHLPETTLMLLVSAFAGRDAILEAYQEAIQKGYRFYSYGDAMFII
jgi:S-adenosylmethionine:tRNA ribosyltransferase-isomerase